jgi:hypothetical protein
MRIRLALLGFRDPSPDIGYIYDVGETLPDLEILYLESQDPIWIKISGTHMRL